MNANNSDVIAIEEQIALHRTSINNLRKELETLLRAKMGVLIKSSPSGKEFAHQSVKFYYNKTGKLCCVYNWGEPFIVGSLTRLLYEDLPYTVCEQVHNVKLE